MILLGDGKGKFNPLSPQESALWVEGDAKNIITLNSFEGKIILVAQNKGQLLAFKKK
jgi:enediyne biosynthesis protein E4